MVEVDADFECALHDVVGFASLHVDNEADAAIFMLMTGVVETLSLRMLWMILHRESVGKVFRAA